MRLGELERAADVVANVGEEGVLSVLAIAAPTGGGREVNSEFALLFITWVKSGLTCTRGAHYQACTSGVLQKEGEGPARCKVRDQGWFTWPSIKIGQKLYERERGLVSERKPSLPSFTKNTIKCLVETQFHGFESEVTEHSREE